MTKEKSIYKKSLLIFTITLLLLSFLFLGFVYGNLKKYEHNLLEPFLLDSIHDLGKNDLKGFLESNGKNSKLLSTYEDLKKRNDYTFVKTEENVYDAYLDGQVLFTIKVKSLGEVSCLGLLKYEKYEVESITPHLENGLIYIETKLPSNYKLIVDGNVYQEYNNEENISGLEYMYYKDAMPKMRTYELKDLEHPVRVEAENFLGEKVSLKKDGVHYSLDNFVVYKTYEEAKQVLGDIDILSIAKDWSLFLSKDLQGASYGFQNFKEYLIPDTDMYKQAYNWAHSIDITFTSSHTLKNPPFTNERIENFIVYGENAFSCEVYLEKHMKVAGEDQTDVMHDTLSFIKENGEWKLMNIKGVKN